MTPAEIRAFADTPERGCTYASIIKPLGEIAAQLMECNENFRRVGAPGSESEPEHTVNPVAEHIRRGAGHIRGANRYHGIEKCLYEIAAELAELKENLRHVRDSGVPAATS